MLYNPTWDFKKIASLDTFTAWLATKPAEQTYNWFDCRGACLFGQYMHAHDIAWGMETYYDLTLAMFGERHPVLYDGAWTYGAALERAKQTNIGRCAAGQ